MACLPERSRLAIGSVVLALPCFGAIGCSITLQHDPLDPPALTRSGPLPYADTAEGFKGRVGWGRGTLFYIPFVPIYITGDQTYGGQMLMREVSDAIATAGYQPVPLAPGMRTDGPMLRCTVESASFNNYTYLFPIVPTWGSMTIAAELVGEDGARLWSHQFRGGGFTLNFFNGYNSAAKQSLEQILNDMVRALAGDEFEVALAKARGPEIATQSAESAAPAVSTPPEDPVPPPAD